MTRLWISLKRSLQCKSVLGDVDVPRAKSNHRNSHRSKAFGSGRSRSVSNLRDVKHANKRHKQKQPYCSPKSLGCIDIALSPSNSTSEPKCTACCVSICCEVATISSSTNPGTPDFGDAGLVSHHSNAIQNSSNRSCDSPISGLVSHECKAALNFSNRSRASPISGCGDNHVSFELTSFEELESCSPSELICRKCGERFSKTAAAAEAHHLSKHAVSELEEGNSSRRIVEIICRATWLQSENSHIHIETSFKVCNMHTRIAMFEDYREIVKIRARQRQSKQMRCLADGNELLRFFGTTIVCSLGLNGSSAVCTMEKCGLCPILRRGFSENEFNGGVGIFTTATGGRALDYIEFEGMEESENYRKAVLVCRAIAGRVHKPLETYEESLWGYDSLAGKVGENAIIEDLYIVDPNAVLPCFVVIFS